MTQQQIDIIVESINNILDQTRDGINNLNEIINEQYLKGRGQYQITSIVYSAFNAEEQNIPGFNIKILEYGGKKKLYLPELSNDEMIIEVFGDTSKPCSTDEVKSKLRLYGSRFKLLIFSVDKVDYVLTKLILVSMEGFDDRGDAKIIDSRLLYEM